VQLPELYCGTRQFPCKEINLRCTDVCSCKSCENRCDKSEESEYDSDVDSDFSDFSDSD